MKISKPTIRPQEWAVLAFTVAYIGIFTTWFFLIGNFEFIVYVATMAVLIVLVGINVRRADFPAPMLWALSIWGLAHMAGGGIPVDGSVLYNLPLIPIIETESFMILKFDQLVHAYGFGVTAWVLWHVMAHHFPVLKGTKTIYVYSALAAMGLGGTNEIIEFSAVLAVPDTNVGGYYNTALDLVFNGLGACVALWIVARHETRRR